MQLHAALAGLRRRARRHARPDAARASRRWRAAAARSERAVATALLELMRGAEHEAGSGEDDPTRVASLLAARSRAAPRCCRRSACASRTPGGAGARLRRRRPAGLSRRRRPGHRRARRLAAAAPQCRAARPACRPGWRALAALLMLFPASEAVVAVINRLISESARPQPPAAAGAAPAASRPSTACWWSIPAMLTGPDAGRRSWRTSCSCTTWPTPNAHAQFALLTDWADADAAHAARRRRRCSAPPCARSTRSTRATRRAPTSRRASSCCTASGTFSETEQRWIGWERKRGKLEQLIAVLADGRRRAVPRPRPGVARSRAGTRYVRHARQRHPVCRRAACASWSAWPRIRTTSRGSTPTAARGRSGYGILQPRVVTPLPAPQRRHALPLAVRRPVRHRPLQRRQLRGLPGPVRRRHASPARACWTCRRCTPCSAAACREGRC